MTQIPPQVYGTCFNFQLMTWHYSGLVC